MLPWSAAVTRTSFWPSSASTSMPVMFCPGHSAERAVSRVQVASMSVMGTDCSRNTNPLAAGWISRSLSSPAAAAYRKYLLPEPSL